VLREHLFFFAFFTGYAVLSFSPRSTAPPGVEGLSGRTPLAYTAGGVQQRHIALAEWFLKLAHLWGFRLLVLSMPWHGPFSMARPVEWAGRPLASPAGTFGSCIYCSRASKRPACGQRRPAMG